MTLCGNAGSAPIKRLIGYCSDEPFDFQCDLRIRPICCIAIILGQSVFVRNKFSEHIGDKQTQNGAAEESDGNIPTHAQPRLESSEHNHRTTQ